jgi:Kef-type K+ transport system membrane component KefB
MVAEAFQYSRHDDYTLTLLGVAVVVVLARLAGALFQRIRQPPVIGEVLVGILLGPSLLGSASEALFPLDSRPLLKMLSTVGLVTFMFLLGLELELTHLSRRMRRVSGAVATCGTVIPFGLGVALAVPLYGAHGDGREFLPFALFLGAALSITAFPVLARILVERNLFGTPLGVVAMACAAADDTLTWATLALVVAIVASTSPWDLPYICLLSLAFAVLMIGVVRPRLAHFAGHHLDPQRLALIFAGLLVSSFVTSAIGIHEIFGAFLIGAVFPRGALAEQVADKLRAICVVLLPVFFVTTGLAVDVKAVGLDGTWQLGLILLMASTGKFAGAILGARLQGLPMREAVALGALMNTRGLTELVVLDLGRQLGILDEGLFTLLVLMAIITTVATGPLLAWLKPDPWLGPVRPAATAPLLPSESLERRSTVPCQENIR